MPADTAAAGRHSTLSLRQIVLVGLTSNNLQTDIMTIEQRNFLKSCSSQYRVDLRENILPFWMKYGYDRKHGGVYTCVDRDGTLMDTTKSVWFQGRFGFIMARAAQLPDADPEWIEAARSAIDFIERYCIDTDGHMFFSVTEDGRPVQKRRYVFSECFAIMAMAEYSLASGDSQYADKALATFKNTLRMLETPGFLPPKILIPGRGHSITMMLINVANIAMRACQDPIFEQRIDQSIDELAKYFMHPEFKTILETVGPQGEFFDTCSGRTINPGHCMETGWFIMDIARSRGWDRKLVEMATTIMDWAWDWGWDQEYGGMINFRDCKGFPSQDYSQDMKFWWPQCETIIASLYAYLATGDGKYLERHKLAHEYAYTYLRDKEYGEWYGYLHRDGSVAQPAKGNLFKGPFHIPRMMMTASELCDEILGKDI